MAPLKKQVSQKIGQPKAIELSYEKAYQPISGTATWCNILIQQFKASSTSKGLLYFFLSSLLGLCWLCAGCSTAHDLEQTVGHCWSLLVTVGHCWSLLVTVGHCWSVCCNMTPGFGKYKVNKRTLEYDGT